MKERLDVILVEQGYAPSREKAKAIIMSGNVYVNGQKEDKAGTGFDEIRKPWWTEAGKGNGAVGLFTGWHDLHGYRSVYRRIHRLYAAERCHEGLLCRCGTGTVSLETPE